MEMVEVYGSRATVAILPEHNTICMNPFTLTDFFFYVLSNVVKKSSSVNWLVTIQEFSLVTV